MLDQARAESEAALEARWEQQDADLAAKRAAEQSAAERAQAAGKALLEAQRLADRFDELDQATRQLETLRNGQATWDTRKAQLTTARQAAALHPVELAAVEASRQLEEEEARGRKLATELAAAQAAQQSADAAHKRETLRTPEQERLTARIAELDALVDKVAALSAARAAHAQAQDDSGRKAAVLQAAQQASKHAAETLQKLEADIQNHRVQLAGLVAVRASRDLLKSRLESALSLAAKSRELAESAPRLEALKSSVASAQRAVVEARARRDATRRAWIAGQAARIARTLIEGQACPVCGAHEHPAPAHAGVDHVSDDALDLAEEALTRAEKKHRDDEQALAQALTQQRILEDRTKEIRASLGDAVTSAEELKNQLDAAAASLAKAEAAEKSLRALESSLPTAREKAKEAENAAQAARTPAQQASSRVQELLGQLREREAGVPTGLTDPKSVASARAKAVQDRDALAKALETATAAATKATTHLAETRARVEACAQARDRFAILQHEKSGAFEQALRARGFAEAAAYRAARLDDAAMAALESEIRTFETALTAAVDRQSRAVVDTRDLIRPDLPARRVEQQTATTAHLCASNAVRDAFAALQATTGFVTSLKKLADEFQSLEARHAVLRQVADVASGANPHRMSFQRYVLATLLEEVLVATTLRLGAMSRGRYEMRRKTERGDRRAAGGLDLEVFDQYTGSTRAVSTLSGGESFLASLALALGLSDVVQSYAGGIRLEAIFVDEGFGTLDPEALDFAIRTLQDLRQAGRMVGIISHVAELKGWIDARLELRASQTGSQATFVT